MVDDMAHEIPCAGAKMSELKWVAEEALHFGGAALTRFRKAADPQTVIDLLELSERLSAEIRRLRAFGW